MWFDTHAHLSDAQFDADREDAIERALQRGVDTIVEIADGPSEWHKARLLSEKFPNNVWWAAGLHPYYADQASDKVWDELLELTKHPRFVAVGEVGLDYAKATIPAEVQKAAFTRAIEIAIQAQKPLIVHCRNAYPDLLPILKERGGTGVIHCFSGTLDDANAVLDMGFYVGVDGPLTYPGAKGLREIMTQIPLERIVLETDAPYLPPQTHRGQRNEPQHVISVGHKLAEIRGLTVTEIAAATHANSKALFHLS